jgi:uncharacterized membrane protein YgcG
MYQQLALHNVVIAGTRMLFPLDLIVRAVYAARPYWPPWLELIAECVAYDDAARAAEAEAGGGGNSGGGGGGASGSGA